MIPVYLSHYEFIGYKAEAELSFEHPLKRRMSPLQLVVMECFERLKRQKPALMQSLRKNTIPIYFATAFGELSSALCVAESIHKDELPCSPTAFQHSVHNCAPAYLTMTQKIHHPSLTISSGCLSFEKAMFFAFHKIRNRRFPAAIVISGNELLTYKHEHQSEAEIVVFSTDQFCAETTTSHELTTFHYAGDAAQAKTMCSDSDPAIPQNQWSESSSVRSCVPPLGAEHGQSFQRVLSNLDGESMSSVWRTLL